MTGRHISFTLSENDDEECFRQEVENGLKKVVLLVQSASVQQS